MVDFPCESKKKNTVNILMANTVLFPMLKAVITIFKGIHYIKVEKVLEVFLHQIFIRFFFLIRIVIAYDAYPLSNIYSLFTERFNSKM
jgi:hypothetical protein